jgi:DNA-binding MarR family transcriptional regulator
MGQTCDRDVADIEQALVALVRRSNDVRAHARLEHRAGTQLGRAAYVVLARIADAEPLRLSDLAAAVGIDLSTASRQVTRLAELGLVERTGDDADRRAAALRLTRAGRATLNRFRAARHEWLTGVLAGWSAAERATFARLLTRFTGELVQASGAAGDS